MGLVMISDEDLVRLAFIRSRRDHRADRAFDSLCGHLEEDSGLPKEECPPGSYRLHFLNAVMSAYGETHDPRLEGMASEIMDYDGDGAAAAVLDFMSKSEGPFAEVRDYLSTLISARDRQRVHDEAHGVPF